jgi:hypothetical protein
MFLAGPIAMTLVRGGLFGATLGAEATADPRRMAPSVSHGSQTPRAAGPAAGHEP